MEPKLSDFVDSHRVPLGYAVRMGRRNLFAGRRNGSNNRSDSARKPRKTAPHDRDGRRCRWGGSRNPGGVDEAGVSFAAAHADGRPQRVLLQKPKLESLNLGGKNFGLLSEAW